MLKRKKTQQTPRPQFWRALWGTPCTCSPAKQASLMKNTWNYHGKSLKTVLRVCSQWRNIYFFFKERKQLQLGNNIEGLWLPNLNPLLPQPLPPLSSQKLHSGKAGLERSAPPPFSPPAGAALSLWERYTRPQAFSTSAVEFLVSTATRRKGESSIVSQAQLLYVKFVPNC